MSRDHLTPEQRPTKDGNLVTRWVRRHTKQSSAASSIPAPGMPKGPADVEKTEAQKKAEEFIAQHRVPANETPEQKDERKARQKLQASYLKTEGMLRWKYRKDDSIDDFEINDLFKHLTAAAQVDPKSIDENLLRDYSAFKKSALKTHMDGRRAAGEKHLDLEVWRPIASMLGERYANHPEDRPYLKGIMETGVFDKEGLEESLRVVHKHPDEFDAILTYLSTRSGPEGLEDYLEYEVKPLRDGTL